MTIGQIVGIGIAGIGSMQRNGLMDAAGNFTKPQTIEAEIAAATKVGADLEPLLKAAGVPIPPEWEKIILALPALFA